MGAAFLVMAPAHAQDAGGVCRVTPAANAGQNGASWASAMGLEQALATSGCDQIWLKQGTYSQATQSKGFVIGRNLQLYGGFKGTETSFAERAVLVDNGLSVLDGQGVRAVLYVDGTGGGGITGATVIDGLTIANGVAKQMVANLGQAVGGGMYCDAHAANTTQGANNQCNPNIHNVTFRDNKALGASGGALMMNGQNSVANPTIRNSTFRDNRAEFGGAIFVYAKGGVSRPHIIDSTFANNVADAQGGAIHSLGDGGISSPKIVGSTFNENSARIHGGALFAYAFGDGTARVEITNSTFARNTTDGDGGALFIDDVAGASPSIIGHSTFYENQARRGGAVHTRGVGGATALDVTASIFWGNKVEGAGATGAQFFNETSAKPAISKSIVEGSPSSVWDNAVGADGGGNLSDNPLLEALADNGGPAHTLRPATGSPAIDRVACTETVDQRGVKRPQGSMCDMGAVERVDVPHQLVVVSQGSGLGIVSSTPMGINACSASEGDCAADFSDSNGVFVTLTASPQAENTFTGWSGDACAGSTSTTCELTMDEAKNVTVTFAANEYVLDIAATDHGSINCTSGGNALTSGQSLGHGATVTCTPEPELHHALKAWSGACSGAGSCSFPMLGDTRIDGEFVRVGGSGDVPGGEIVLELDGGGCTLASGPTYSAAPSSGAPAGYDFPFGQIGFTATGCDRRASIDVRLTLPGNLPSNTKLFKLLDGQWLGWNGSAEGNTVRFSVTDDDGSSTASATGDSDPTPSTIQDPVLIAVPQPVVPQPMTMPVPGLGQWALMLLSALTAGLAFRARKRRV